MIIFFKRFLKFILPIFFILIFPVAVFYFAGEFIPIERIHESMGRGPVLYGKAYIVEDEYDFKIPLIQKKVPIVMTLGNSRVLQFRQGFFKDGVSFYNGGSLINNFNDLKRVLEELPEGKKPKVVIIGLDFYLFHPEKDKLYRVQDEKVVFSDKMISGFRHIYRDLFLGKYSLLDVSGSKNEDNVLGIGLKARINNDGFRNDGSYYYGKFISDPNNPKNEDYHFQDILRRIEHGTQSFFWGKEISNVPIKALASFLEYADQNNIHVIGFFPPYAPTVYDELMRRKEDYAYMSKVDPAIRPLFFKGRHKLFDFSDIRNLGSSDKEFVDGFHGGEKAYLRFFIKMAEEDQILRQFTDTEFLKEKLKNAPNDFEIFGN